MILSTKVLGAAVVKSLSARAAAPLLRIGADSFDRAALANVQCWNFTAAANLSRVLADLNVKHTRDLFDRVPPSALVVPRLGAISLAVLGAAFEHKGLGGAAPLESWVLRHRREAGQPIVTFHRMKAAQRTIDDAAETRAASRQRKHARRNQAQRLRVSRFLERQRRTGT